MAATDSSANSASFAASVDARARALRLCATRRWLVKDELVFLLLHHRQQSAIPRFHALQSRPTSGTLLFYDTADVADFKKDGWRWQKRKDNSGRVREDRAKLVINREVIILGTYVHSEDIPTFHRRNYYLRDSNQHVMLVHYFDEVHKIDPSLGGLVPSKTQPLPRSMPAAAAVLTPGSSQRVFKRTLQTSGASQMNSLAPMPAIKVDPDFDGNHSGIDAMMKDCFAMDYALSHDQHPPQMDQSTSAIFPHFEDDDALLSDLSGLLSPASSSSHDVMHPGTMVPAALVQISDFSPGWDFVQGGAKILLCLAAPLPPPVGASCNLSVQFGLLARSPAERVSDTVVRCAAPSALSAGSVDLFVCYCSSSMSDDCIQLSTLGRFQYRSVLTSPAPAPSFADENLVVQVESLPDIQTMANTGKRGRSPGAGRRSQLNLSDVSKPTEGRRWSNPDCGNLSAFADTDLDERQCKIRVVERLAEFQDAIRTTSTCTTLDRDSNTDSSANTQENMSTDVSSAASREGAMRDEASAPTLDDGAIEALSDQDLESLSEQLIENVVRQLITVAHTSEELLDELNSLDETGLSLLHYVSFYNYSHLIPLLLSHGAQVNQQSTQGQTPLHLAAGCGHDQVVTELLEARADAFALDFDGFTPAERAEKSGHASVSQQLRKHMSESTVLECTFEAQMLNGGVWEGSIEHMDVDQEDGELSSTHSSQTRFTPEMTSMDGDLGGSGDFVGTSPSIPRGASYAGENQEHNRKLLLGAFSTMSLHDKCALSLSISRDLSSSNTSAKRRGSSISEDSVSALITQGSSSASSPSKGTELFSGGVGVIENEGIHDSDVKSVIADDEENLSKLEAAMELMGPEEIQSLEEEACVIQSNVRAWLLRRNCRNMRETTKRLHEATRNIENQQKQDEEKHMQAVERELMSQQEISERERAAVTVQAAARSMLARKSFLQTRQVTIKVQAATRGVLCRKNFARMKTHALASLVIQRNVREWLSKHPAGIASPLDNSQVAIRNLSTGSSENGSEMVHHHSDQKVSSEDEDEALIRELDAALEAPAFGACMTP